MALAINASLDPKDVLHKISEHTAQTMNCKACTIRLLDSTGHFLLPSAAGEPGRDSFYDNMWRSSTELFYVMYKVGD